MRFTGLALGLALLAAPAILAGDRAGRGGGNGHENDGGFRGAPEPLTVLGLAVGAGGIALLRRRRRS